MNVLAEEEKKLFRQGLSEEEYLKKKEEFLELYFKVRNNTEGKFYSNLTLKQRKKLHWLILGIYTLKNKLEGFSYEVLSDKRQKTNRPIIFVITHVGKYDIEIVSEAIKDHYYLLSGDYEHLQGTISEPFLGLNGVFYFNEFVKEDRKLVSEKMVSHLKENGNLMYFIEGTWNLTPNLPMLPCYWGIVDIAKSTNAIVIPVAAEQYDKHFKINIGSNFDMNLYNDGNAEKARAILDLRDVLSTLKWEIWETERASRKDIDLKEWDDYIKKRFSEWPYFDLDYIERLIYHPKDVINQEEVYAPVKKLSPNLQNAFLYDKRIQG